LVVTLTALVAFVASQSPAVFQPFLWATPHVATLSAGSIHYYHAPLCSIQQYDQKSLNISADLQAYPWSPDNEIVLYISVYNNPSFTGNPLADNKDPSTGRALQNFLFSYKVSFGDLYLQVATGPSPTSLDYTIAIIVADNSSQDTSSVLTKFRANSVPSSSSSSSSVVIVEMLQLLSNPHPFRVQTSVLNPLLIDFTFCPIGDEYQLDIIVVSVDQISSFSTYVCTNFSASQPCNSNRAPYHDPSAAALNHITLATNLHEFTTLEAAIYGVGNYQQWNSFLFSVAVAPGVN